METNRMPAIRSKGPRLESIRMVESTIKENSGKFTKYQLWHKLPKGMQYPILNTILEYLEESNKIRFDEKARIVWISISGFAGKPAEPEPLRA